ncbi:ATP-grasp domain-containing protein [Marinilabilia rubra]|uniref:ATP-grasp domain-containing protein n=1 Tax=Marinilabilia rubra TaxID=2162893 RepID=A0A2U2B3N7_9BACT|nr:ATP-grasp domain-containing protein [Marinilabilia rubra]PWD97682.1 hypothetical protein DDZ16_19520 [Marinilabilia rubra]
MNILISSVGRQAYLVKAFIQALGNQGRVYAVDCDEKAVGLKTADDFFIAPPFSSSEYVPWIIQICEKYNIKLLVSLNVDDILILKKSENLFSHLDCFILGADYETMSLSNDKYQLPLLSQKLNLPSAKTFLVSQDFDIEMIHELPVIAKPRYGKGARGNFILKEKKDLIEFLETNKGDIPYVLQEFISGEEYGFDVINDLNGNFLRLYGRKKLLQYNGESFRAKTVHPKFWEEPALKWSKWLKHTGTANFDVIFKDGKGYLIDLNLRFSGDYVFSHIAGANTPQLLIDNLLKLPMGEKTYQPKIEVIGERLDYGAKII